MRLRHRTLLALSIACLSACQGPSWLQPTPPKAGLDWTDAQTAMGHLVTGTVTAPAGAVVGKVYLATAGGDPVPGLFPGLADAQGGYVIKRAPGHQTFLVIAEARLSDGRAIELKTLTRLQGGHVTADLNEATTVATEWALQGGKGVLGGFDGDAFGQVVGATYRLLNLRTPGIRTIQDVVKELNRLAATDDELKAAMTAVKTELATLRLSVEDAQKAIAELKGRMSTAETALSALKTAQAETDTKLQQLDATTKALQTTLHDEVKPRLTTLETQQADLAKQLTDLKAKTEQDILALQEQQKAIAEALQALQTFTQAELDKLNAKIGALSDTIDANKAATEQHIKDVQTALQGQIELLKGEIGSLKTQLQQEVSARQQADGALDAKIGQLEALVGGLNTSVTSLNASVGTLQGQVADLEAAQAQTGGQVNALTTKAGTLEGLITALTSRVVTLEGAASTLQSSAANYAIAPFAQGANVTIPADGLTLTSVTLKTKGGPIFISHKINLTRGTPQTLPSAQVVIDGISGFTTNATPPAVGTPVTFTTNRLVPIAAGDHVITLRLVRGGSANHQLSAVEAEMLTFELK